MTMRFMKLRENAKTPERKSEGAAGFDIYAAWNPDEHGETLIIEPWSTVRVPTGIAVEIPSAWMGLIFPRSSWTDSFDTKHPPIDPDYRGEIHVILSNTSCSEQVIHNGDRVAQLVIVTALTPPLMEVQELSKTDRGAGGFGSTGQK
jgi:dUTP pyrophosphatase